MRWLSLSDAVFAIILGLMPQRLFLLIRCPG